MEEKLRVSGFVLRDMVTGSPNPDLLFVLLYYSSYCIQSYWFRGGEDVRFVLLYLRSLV